MPLRAPTALFLAAAAVCAHAQQCAIADGAKSDCYPWDVANATVCAAHGCCWSPSANASVPSCYYGTLPAPSAAQCAAVSVPSRITCFPEPKPSQAGCEARGCCWSPFNGTSASSGIASCFFPLSPGYSATAPSPSVNGSGFTSTLTSLGRGYYGNDVSPLSLTVSYDTATQVHITITDASRSRWRPPVPLTPPPTRSGGDGGGNDYIVNMTTSPFALWVTRASSGAVLFDTRPGSGGVATSGLIFEEQYMEWSTALPSDAEGNVHIFGLAEHIVPFQLPVNGSAGQIYTLWPRDQGTPVHNPWGNTNLYASQPFYMIVDPATGTAFGVFLFNSNAMDVLLQPNVLTYCVLGGQLEFFLFTGPTPADVIAQYQSLVGKPHMPPRWALGFHLCRWGYGSLNKTQFIWQSMLNESMPQDAQWSDIDYMNNHLDFTTDPIKYPAADMAAWVNEMHSTYGQRYTMIIDPGISNAQAPGSYPPWDDGLAAGVFINNPNGSVFIGQVWPGTTGFPDWTHPNTSAWWRAQLQAFHDQIPFDGAWIDMNEPSNFVSGGCQQGSNVTGDVKFPPYLPGRLGGAKLLEDKTIAMAAVQYAGLHYDVHALYGWGEGVATASAMENIKKERSLVISRSTFPSSGHYNGHWLGDNQATYDDLYYSIPGTLTMNMLGIPLVGADVCGFAGPATTPELCTRWMQLGSMTYGFMRNHNTEGKADQTPALFAEPYRSYMRDTLNTRLSLVPYIYTAFFHAHVDGVPVTRPLWYGFPADPAVAALDTQVLFGPALLVSPVLIQGDVSKLAYFPAATWYDWFSGAPLGASTPGTLNISAPLSSIPVHVMGGSIVPTQDPNMTTAFSALNAFRLTVALVPGGGSASGDMFLDDGVTIDSYEVGAYSLMTWTATAGLLTGRANATFYAPPQSATLQSVRILGVQSFSNGAVTVNGAAAVWAYNASVAVLTVTMNVPVLAPLTVTWSGQ